MELNSQIAGASGTNRRRVSVVRNRDMHLHPCLAIMELLLVTTNNDAEQRFV